MSTPWLSVLSQFEDQLTPLDAENLNKVVTELAQRDQHLYEQVAAAFSKSATYARLQIASGSGVGIGDWVYQASDGLRKATPTVEGTALPSSTPVLPAQSSYPVGIVTLVEGSVATVCLGGLHHFEFPITPFTLQSGAESRVGPYYLSGTEAGKLNTVPAVLPVFCAILVDDHTIIAAPKTADPFDFFTSHQFNLLDRQAGAGAANSQKLGWIDATGHPMQPAGALYRYNIPTNAQLDAEVANGTLTEYQVSEAKLLRASLPAWPLDFAALFVNGVRQMYRNDSEGVFSLDAAGNIWWYLPGETPWASDESWSGGDTVYTPGTDELRPRQQLSFTKINPAVRFAVVTALHTKSGTPISIKSRTTGAAAYTGDLEIALNLDLVSETNQTPQPGSGTAVNAIEELDGAWRLTRGPVVSSIFTAPGSGLQVSRDASTGVVTLSPISGIVGSAVQYIEPENATLRSRGLLQYLQLPAPGAVQSSAIVSGLIGQIVLPSSLPVGTALKISPVLFGESSISGNGGLRFTFEWSVLGVSGVVPASPQSVTQIDLTLPNAPAFALHQPAATTFVIPAENLQPNGVVSFRLTRRFVTGGSGYNTGNLGLARLNWFF